MQLQIQRIYYNFIKLHQSLDGKTPAEKGVKNQIKLDEIIKWFALGYEVMGQLTATKCNHCWQFKSFGVSEKKLQYQY